MSIYGIFRNDVRLGTVMRFVGEPKATRWAAYGPHDVKKGFPTLRAATAWLGELAEQPDAADHKGSGSGPDGSP
ncbi:hypothetical protein ACO34A_13270 [Rhizobium sp. ACO-34A]|nr:hypothetical protein [Rhizobium sp. ACO-34A]ATN34771.1 hypothetical protein ACO34A_13270 [Rhizobium sp. ACO-34A]